MRFDHFSFGTIRIDGSTCQHDVVIDRGKVRKRKKGPSKQFSNPSGHTPLSIEEKIPWKCRQLIIGTGILKDNGEDVKVVQELLRHASSKMTLDVYAQALTPAKRAAQSKIVQMIRGGTQCTASVPRTTATRI
jgi:hypothetical protein